MRSKKRVLVVDDELAIGNMIAACCDMWGLEPIVATTGSEALSIAAIPPAPDVIVTDFMMPQMNGHELVSALRRDPRLKDVPVVLMSAVPDAARRNAPSDAFLAKPLDLDELERTLDHWLCRGKRGSRRRT